MAWKIGESRGFDVSDKIPWNIYCHSDGRISLEIFLPEREMLYVESKLSPQEIVKLLINLNKHLKDTYPDFNFEGM